jgi:hypothetical protein
MMHILSLGLLSWPSVVSGPFLIVVYGEKQGSLGHLCSMKTPYLMIAESLYVGPNVLSLNLCSGLKDFVMVKFVMCHPVSYGISL